ncbi:hypothetical protein [Streptomyces nodosus]|uniref:hypothetical protein n=1 Tax=Streptomyces nodosus TaxID=40318 RepID=UPI003808E8DA
MTVNRFEPHPDIQSWLALHDGSALDPRLVAGAFVPTDFPLLGTVDMRNGLRGMEEVVPGPRRRTRPSTSSA